MSIIHTVLTAPEIDRVCTRDRSYLKRKLHEHCLLNSLLNRPINQPLLAELRCLLDRKPIPRRKVEQYRRNSKVRVFRLGVLVRIEHCNGKVLKYV